MAAHRYWRLSSLVAYGRGALSLSGLALLSAAGSVLDASVAPTASAAPATGSIANLRDGDASTSARWSSASALALTWDFGGSPVDAGSIRLGATNAPAEFPQQAVLFWSDDGSTWAREARFENIAFPGLRQTTQSREWISLSDRGTTVMLINGRGSNGSTTIHDLCGLPVTLGSGASISTADADFPEGAISLLGGTGFASFPSTKARFEFPGDFYIGFDIKATAAFQMYATALGMYSSYGPNGGIAIFMRHNSFTGGTPKFVVNVNGTAPSGLYTSGPTLVVGQKYRFELTRQGTTLYAFVDGTLIGTATESATLRLDASHGRLGRVVDAPASNVDYDFTGLMGRIKIVNGEALYTSSHSVPTGYEGRQAPYMTDLLGAGARSSAGVESRAWPRPSVVTAAAAMPARSRRNFYQGGFGRYVGQIVGTVKDKGMPAGSPNVPQQERVRLYRQRDGEKVAETWSNALGSYAFTGIDETETYYVVALDKEGLYRAVIANDLTPEVVA